MFSWLQRTVTVLILFSFYGCSQGVSLSPGIPSDKQCFLFLTPESLKSQSSCEFLTSKESCTYRSDCIWSGNDPWGIQSLRYKPCWSKAVRSCEEFAANAGCLRIAAGGGAPAALPNGATYAPCFGSKPGPWSQRINGKAVMISGPGKGTQVTR